MKKVLSMVLLGLICLNGYSQELKNAVKYLPVNLALNSLSFEYERMLNPKNSIEFNIGVPLNNAFISKYAENWANDQQISNDKMGTFILRAAYRHYTGKSALPKGFYLSPYLKFQAINASLDKIRIIDELDGAIETPMPGYESFDIMIKTFGAGLQLGYQFLISNKVTLDLYFLGIEGGAGSMNTSISNSDPENVSELKTDMEDAVADLPSFLSNKIDVSSSGNTVRIKGSNLPFPSFRSGFSLGIAF